MTFMKLFSVSAFLFLVLTACTEAGEEGDDGLDCGEYGTLHDGHCHCAEGFAFNGETCVALSQVTTVCTESDHADTDNAGSEDHTHSHSACICADAPACPCDGELTTSGVKTYCLPDFHEE